MNLKMYGAIAISTVFLMSACAGSTDENDDSTISTEENVDLVETEATNTCDCKSDWFNGTTILAPNEGSTSPFAAASTTNCLFHQWAWQKFLYLTQVPSGESLPFFMSKMEQVNSNMDLVPNQGGIMVLSENKQAGGGGILTSNDTYNGTSDIVHYSIHISDQFRMDATNFEALIKADPTKRNNRETFSVGALELKVSWVNSSTLKSSDLANYYTTDAYINGTKTNVALLGMHVVGVVENHPEFIWATFEHYDLAAYYNWENTTTSDVPVTSNENLPFFNSNDNAGLSAISWAYGDSTLRSPNNVFAINKYGTPRIAGGGFMTGTSQADGQTNFENIDHLNQSVMDTLNAKGSAENILWTNYFNNGAIWMNMDGLSHDEQVDTILAYVNDFGNVNAGTQLRGSVNTFNVTMETYEQTKSKTSIHAMTVDSLMNCLDCHGPSSYLPIGGVTNAQSPIYLSHIFMNHISDQAPAMKLEDLKTLRFSLFEKYRSDK